MNQKRSETLVKKVNLNTDFLISRLQNIISLSASTSTQEIQASEMLQIESNTMMIIRLVEELLSISRTLRENWILGQMPQADSIKSEDNTDSLSGISEKIDLVLGKIVQGVKFEGEVDEEGEEEEEQEEEEEDEVEVKQEDVDMNKDIKLEDDVEVKQEAASVVKTEPGVRIEIDSFEETPQVKDELPGQQLDLPQNQLEIIDIDDFNGETNGMLGLDGDLQPLTLGSDGNLGEIDFESFGNVGPDNTNDIIMLD